MSKEGSHDTPESELADRLATRGPTPENLTGLLIGITEGERELIVSALRCARSERTPIDAITPEGHKARHVELHKALDELFANFIQHNPDLSTYTKQPIIALMEWSHSQTIQPTEVPK